MKTHGHYETISSVKYACGVVDCLYGREIKNTKVKQNLFRAKKRQHRSTKPKKRGAIMKTEQEQIEEMQEIIGDCWEFDSVSAELGNGDGYINIEEAAKALVQAGYGDVLEYKAEIERLKAETSNISKETAKEILYMLYDMGVDKEILECCRIFDVNGVSLAKQICEKYGVEIEK